MFKRLVLFVGAALFFGLFMTFYALSDQGIKIVKNPSADLLASEGVHQWQTWEKEPSIFEWYFPHTEKAYILEGKVHIRAEGSNEVHVLEKGDFVTFAPGLIAHWDVKEPFKKHVTQEKDIVSRVYWKVAFKMQSISRRIKEAGAGFAMDSA